MFCDRGSSSRRAIAKVCAWRARFEGTEDVAIDPAITLWLLAMAPSHVHAATRVALVIGNSAYVHTPRLENPRNDAADVSAALRKLGFRILDGFDLGKTAFEHKIRDFAAALHGADAGVFFYAGHGLQSAARISSCRSMRNFQVPMPSTSR